jgi:uncharacterized hydrophobic protein (TIGR00271 family)
MVSPPELTELLADALIADSDVSNLVVLTGSARRPDGDAVHFDVLARSANSVLRQVQAQILIVGAMVVGPEYNAIMGVALGIDKRDRPTILRGSAALLAGFSAAIIVTLLFGLAIRWSGHTPKAYSLGVRPVSSLIDKPNLFSVVVAVLAGIVGVVSLTEARASALIGVFISVTTIPAAADIGLSTAYASWTEAWGSTLQLLLNVVILIAIGALGLRLQRIIWRTRSRAEQPEAGSPLSVTEPSAGDSG